MFCQYCGTKLQEAAAFCHECGKAVSVQPIYTKPIPTSTETISAQKLSRETLIFGILGLSLCLLGVPGIVLSSIATSKANHIKKTTGQLSNQALTGYRLAKAGKIVSIIATVVWAFLLPALINGEISYSSPYEYF